MLPSGNVMADPTFLTSATLAHLFGPTAILALLAVLVTLLVIFVGLIVEFRSVAALRPGGSSPHPGRFRARFPRRSDELPRSP